MSNSNTPYLGFGVCNINIVKERDERAASKLRGGD